MVHAVIDTALKQVVLSKWDPNAEPGSLDIHERGGAYLITNNRTDMKQSCVVQLSREECLELASALLGVATGKLF